jgi:UPF0716 protein FxsA
LSLTYPHQSTYVKIFYPDCGHLSASLSVGYHDWSLEPIMPFLFLLFVFVPIIEITLFVYIGGEIGALSTIGMVILTAVVGSMLLRSQGLATLARLREVTGAGGIPGRELLEGVLLLFGGALLLTPGFFTDAVGLLLMTPLVRQWLVAQSLARFDPLRFRGAPGGQEGGSSDPQSGPVIIEGEFRREDRKQ